MESSSVLRLEDLRSGIKIKLDNTYILQYYSLLDTTQDFQLFISHFYLDTENDDNSYKLRWIINSKQNYFRHHNLEHLKYLFYILLLLF